jgi:DNA-binding LacI/PurR family transcriptional regulator
MTMADIAAIAGVSVSTVSRALRGNPAIPKSTRERIMLIAAEHQYALDQRAQNFRLQRSQTIAAVFPYLGNSRRLLSDPFYMEGIGAITDALEPQRYDLIVARVSAAQDDWCLRYVNSKRVDGLILIDRALEDRGVNTLREMGVPFVVWGMKLPGEAYTAVGSDGTAGAALAVAHLARLGRRQIGFIGGSPHMAETHVRALGYRAGLAAAGLAYDERRTFFTDFSAPAGHQAMHALLDRAPDLDAVFICSDFMAMAALQVIAQRGRRVPDDIAVVGYDDIALAGQCSPRLTTIRQDIHACGRLLVQKLFQQLEGHEAPSETLRPELIIRESCGAAGRA